MLWENFDIRADRRSAHTRDKLVILSTCAGMRHSDAGGSIHFLLLSCPISRLFAWSSPQLSSHALESVAAACALDPRLDPCISLSLRLLTNPPFASLMVHAAWVCVSLFTWVDPSNEPLTSSKDNEREVRILAVSLSQSDSLSLGVHVVTFTK